MNLSGKAAKVSENNFHLFPFYSHIVRVLCTHISHEYLDDDDDDLKRKEEKVLKLKTLKKEK